MSVKGDLCGLEILVKIEDATAQKLWHSVANLAAVKQKNYVGALDLQKMFVITVLGLVFLSRFSASAEPVHFKARGSILFLVRKQWRPFRSFILMFHISISILIHMKTRGTLTLAQKYSQMHSPCACVFWLSCKCEN